MSECKNKECTREAYVLDKPYCSSMCCISDLERQLAEARGRIDDYKYDLETLVSVVTDCLNKMSSGECYDTLQQVADHYKKLKEQGE